MMSVKQTLPSREAAVSGARRGLVAVGVLLTAAYAIGSGHNIVDEGPTVATWSVLLGVPVAFATTAAVVAVWADESLAVPVFVRWTLTGAVLMVWLPAGAAALMTMRPSAVTATLLFGSMAGPFLFVADIYYDVPVLTPLVDEGRLALEVSA